MTARINKFPIIRQRHSSGCGPACILMVTRYFGLHYSRRFIEQQCGNWKPEGMSERRFVNVLRRLGLATTTSTNTQWHQLVYLSRSTAALVVSWMLDGNIGHFSVVERVTSTHIWLADPETATYVRFSKYAFLRLWHHYNSLWYPRRTSDITLRWVAVVHGSSRPALSGFTHLGVATARRRGRPKRRQ